MSTPKVLEHHPNVKTQADEDDVSVVVSCQVDLLVMYVSIRDKIDVYLHRLASDTPRQAWQ